MRRLILLLSMVAFGASNLVGQSSDYYIGLSKNFLQAMKDGNVTKANEYADSYPSIDSKALKKALDTDKKKLAFWINTYNAHIQYLLTQKPELYDDRGAFFSEERMVIAGEKVSFDDLEHGILRRGVSKYSGGYVKNPFAYRWAEGFEVGKVDWRIHFALNCGALSCPRVDIYDNKALDRQLNESSKKYLQSQVKYRKADNEVDVPALMLWFRADFGGISGCKQILKDFGLIPKDSNPSLDYNDYDWTLALGTFYN